MHAFIESDMYDYGTIFHFPKELFANNPFWRVPKYSQFEFGNLIYSSKTESEFELCVQTRLRKYSAAYQAQERDCQKHIKPFSRASGRDNTLAAERFFSIFAGQKTKFKNQSLKNPFLRKSIFKNSNLKKSTYIKIHFGKIKF